MRPVTINFIANPFLPIPPLKGGGVEVYLYNLALELSKRHKVRIYSRRYKGLKNREIIGNLEIIRLPGFERGDVHFLYIMQEFLFGLFISIFIKKADINHFFHLKSFIIYLFRPKRNKSIVHLQIAFGGITSKFLRFADMNVCNSGYIMTFYNDKAKVAHNKIMMIPNGVDIEKFNKREPRDEIKEKYNLRGYIIGYAGRISKEKGIEYLIAAFKIVRARRDDVSLLVIGPYETDEYGDPLFYAHLRRIIQGHDLEKDVRFTGLVNHETLPNYYAVCDLMIFPSDWDEPFGIVCIEALACGKPVIVTDSGAFREIVANGLNGFIVPKKDFCSIAKTIISLLDDKPLRERISEAAFERAKIYSFEAIAKEYEELYDTLI